VVRRSRNLGGVDPVANPEVGPAEFRATMAHFAAGVSVVMSELDGEDVGMTATALCSISLDPPTVLLGVGEGSRMHEALTTQDTWTVSFLPASARQVATRFAIKGRPSDRLLLADLAWHRGPATGHVILDEAVAALECVTEQRVVVADHVLMIARVVGVQSRNPGAAPLVHFRNRYRTVADPASEPGGGH
jgi:flavin reductase (DIM6/NTAB) family NADH-FMN oxidoreductase RutF